MKKTAIAMDFSKGKEHQVTNTLVPIGGKLPLFQELQTGKLMDVLQAFVPPERQTKGLRQKIKNWLYPKTRPGYYLEIDDDFHLAYADQRDGHSTQHYWRIFYSDRYKGKIEATLQGTSLVLGKDAPKSSNGNGNANAPMEWGGMYFRSVAEIRIAQALDNQGVLFFGNIRGRIGIKGSPVSEDSGYLTGRLELDFLVFHHHKTMILEVDGKQHNESDRAGRDYVRDHVLLREGIPTVRFTAQECMQRPAEVVAEFLGLF